MFYVLKRLFDVRLEEESVELGEREEGRCVLPEGEDLVVEVGSVWSRVAIVVLQVAHVRGQHRSGKEQPQQWRRVSGRLTISGMYRTYC